MPLVNLPELHDGRANGSQVVKLVNQIRLRVNNLPDSIASETLTTAGTGVYTVIWGSLVATDTVYKLTASVIGATANGSEGAAYTIECAIINKAGVISFVGLTQQKTFEREDNPLTDALFVISGTGIGLEVLDAGVQTTLWHARVYAEKLA